MSERPSTRSYIDPDSPSSVDLDLGLGNSLAPPSGSGTDEPTPQTPFPTQSAGPRQLHGAVSGEDVRLVQSTLRELGYDPGTIDGIYGKLTAAAVEKFQAAQGLQVDGVVGSSTWASLASVPDSGLSGRQFTRNLVGAVAGEDVRNVQSALQAAGFDPGEQDGVYGRKTATAVTRFQRAKELSADGIVGPQTLSALIPRSFGVSASVAEALNGVYPDDTATGLAGRVFTAHGDYASGRVRTVRLVSSPQQPRLTAAEWLSRVQEVLDPQGVPVIHGRLFVIALALIDLDLRSQLDDTGIFTGLVEELREPLDAQLSPLGRDLLQQNSNPTDGPLPGPDLPPSPDARVQLLAGATVDTVPEPGNGAVRRADRLGITAEVEMLVSVLLAKDTPLPLAVGLFGDWGTGKSFFMSEMEERTAELSALAAEGRPEGAPFCRAVRQIRFNAWHYADTDLWASLATTMFDQLARPSSTSLATGQEQQGINAARQELADAQARKAELAREVERLEARAERPSAAILATTGQVIRAVRDDPDLRATLRREADPAGGNAPVGDPTEQLVTVLGDIDGTTERVKTLWTLSKEEALHRHRWVTVVTFAVIGVILAGLWTLAGWTGWTKVLSAVAGVIAVASPALVMAGRVLSLARQARLAREKPLLDKRAQLAELERDVAAREQELADLRDQGLRLQQFVRARAASSVYRDKLGVISKVRTDFEELVGLIHSAQLADEGGDNEHATAAKAVVAAAVAADVAVPSVDRIILYIDDLDRCPPRKVMDVLQAVHLLLAFKLFVVVVGVDSRWLERSLEKHFVDMLDEPDNYLEKIFQIPFALRRMTPAGYRDLIGGLTPAAPAPAEDAVSTATAAPSSASGGAPADVDILGSAAAPGAQTGQNAAVERTSELAPFTTPPTTPPPPRLEALFLSDPERALLQQLGAVIGTPRSAKRLINIYRMLRVSVPDDELDRFRPDGGGEYQCVVILLAILIGRPDDATSVFTKILAARAPQDIWTVLGSFRDLLEPLRALDGIQVTALEPYARWAPRVARFSFRLSAGTAATPHLENDRTRAPAASRRNPQTGSGGSTTAQYRSALRRRHAASPLES